MSHSVLSAIPGVSTEALTSVYALSDPCSGEVRYVGKSTRPTVRLREHVSPFWLRANTKKNNWIKNVLASGGTPSMEILEWVPADHADEVERYWIRQLALMGCHLTNGTEGGDGGAVTSPEGKARIRAAHLGRKTTEETRQKMSASHRARLAKPEEREKWRQVALRNGNRPPVRRGEANNMARLTEAQVLGMRERCEAGESRKSLAVAFDIAPGQVSEIVTGHTWMHVGGPIQVRKVKQKLSEQQVLEIKGEVASGKSQIEVAREFNINPSYVSMICSGKARKKTSQSGSDTAPHRR